MGVGLIRRLILLLVSVAIVPVISGCSSGNKITLAQYPHPVVVVSVLDTYQPGQTVNPGGPEIEITLKNVSGEPIITLNAVLDEDRPVNYDFDFDVTPSNPLLENESISARRILIGGAGEVAGEVALTIP